LSVERVAIIGGGAWGTALAVHLGRLGRTVRQWVREPEVVARMLERRDNPAYLPGIAIPDLVEPTTDLEAALRGVSLAVVAVPTPFARPVYRELAPFVAPDLPVVVAAKGIEEGSLALPAELAAQELGARARIAVISGPSFADEVARGLATAIVAASSDADLALRARDALAGGALRLYTNHDVVGVQVAGALKNVIAIAAGVAEGAGLGRNTLAALITRGLAEMRRLGLALGGKPATFSGLAGLGDLVLTCTGDLSRNRQVGFAIARGERVEDVLARTKHVAEGVHTTVSARALAARCGVEMPIVEQVYRVLHEDVAPVEAVRRLMSRPLTSEEAREAEPSA
jgi:glycerol-3-phosphate dehydrogenase (NAD(P)+)